MSSATVAEPILDRETFGEVYAKCQIELQKWQSSEQPTIRWRNSAAKSISEGLYETWAALIEAASVQEVAAELYAPILALDKFQDAFEHWANDWEAMPDQTRPSGSDEMWQAWKEFQLAMQIPTFKKPEPIGQLTRQGVADRQIALIYGWTNEINEPDTDRVSEERAQPGRHYNPAKWVHPSQKRRHAELAELWAERKARVLVEAQDLRAAPRDAPESVAELITQRVSVEQICRMKGVDEEHVRTVAAGLGVPVDGELSPPIDNRVDPSVLDTSLETTQETSVPSAIDQITETTPMPEAVLLLAAEGNNAEAIHSLLAEQYPSLTLEIATKIIGEVDELADI